MESVTLEFRSIEKGSLAVLTLNRPEVSNALSGEMIERMTSLISEVDAKGESCRALVVRATGKHFSGGADLEWMKHSATLSLEENLTESRRLSDLFKSLAHVGVPSIAVVHGAAFGGAVGLVACCDWAIAVDNAKFCLSEVRVGLLPATILPYLVRKMLPGHLRRYGLSARPFGATEALEAGLVQRVVTPGDVDAAVRDELKFVLAGSPLAQRTFKQLHLAVSEGPRALWSEHESLMIKGIAEARVSEMGQKGLNAFFEKRPAEWVAGVGDDWKL